jgi:hypothetical protein
MRAVRRLRRALHWAPIAAWAATAGAVLIGAYILRRQYDIGLLDFLWREPALLIVVTLLLAGFARRRARHALLGNAPDPSPASERGFRIGIWLACAVIMCLPGGIRKWSCPHGSGFGIGPIGVAHSAVGGPCRNTVNWDRVWRVSDAWYVWLDL